MTDYFLLLNEPRRPWLDSERLKEKFLQLSAAIHPDRVHSLPESERAAAQERYVELNAAYQHLRDPRNRLRHFLQLELGALPKDIQNIPAHLTELFMRVGQLCRETDALLLEKSKITSPLLKVQFFERGQDQSDRVMNLLRDLNHRRETITQQLQEIDAQWETADESVRVNLREQLQTLLHLFGFYDRWIAQLQERVARLTF